MQYREITTPGTSAERERTYVVILDEGDEAVAALTSFAREEQLSAAQVTAVGAFRRAVVGWFDRQTSDYRRVTVGQQCEVLSLIGDVALGTDGNPALHLHAVLGLPDATTRGGHLLEGEVWPTLEVVVRESPAQLRKTMRPEIGLALIDLDRAEH
ncbi:MULTISPECIES: PPC domain-containing DNA-binding protein [unclassified Blastococcus]